MAKKKGFMTPERKKKLRTLLRKKAAEELKKEQERKAAERQRVISERCGVKKDIDNASDDELKKIVKEYFDKWFNLEGEMFSIFFRKFCTIPRVSEREKLSPVQLIHFESSSLINKSK